MKQELIHALRSNVHVMKGWAKDRFFFDENIYNLITPDIAANALESIDNRPDWMDWSEVLV